MCQISVLVEKDGMEELRLDDVTGLSVEETGVKVSTLFEGATEIPGVVIRSIDFMGGTVFLQKSS
jgi:predicted RNA-binding protein